MVHAIARGIIAFWVSFVVSRMILTALMPTRPPHIAEPFVTSFVDVPPAGVSGDWWRDVPSDSDFAAANSSLNGMLVRNRSIFFDGRGDLRFDDEAVEDCEAEQLLTDAPGSANETAGMRVPRCVRWQEAWDADARAVSSTGAAHNPFILVATAVVSDPAKGLPAVEEGPGARCCATFTATAIRRAAATADSAFDVMNMQGSRIGPGRWAVLAWTVGFGPNGGVGGALLPPGSPLSRRISERSRKLLFNASDAWQSFAAIQNFTHFLLNVTEAQEAAKTNSTNTTAPHAKALRAVGAYARSRGCFYFGEISGHREESARGGRAGALRGRLVSTCGAPGDIRFEASTSAYEGDAAAINAVTLIAALFPFGTYCLGLFAQWRWLHNSRGRVMQLSVPQLALVQVWLMFLLYFFELHDVVPSALRSARLAYVPSAIAGMSSVTMLSLAINEQYRNSRNVRLGFIAGLVLCVFTCGFVFFTLRAFLLSPLMLLIGCGCFWLPQLFGIVWGSTSKGLAPGYVLGTTSLPLWVCWLLLFVPETPLIQRTGNPRFVVMCAALVVCEALLVFRLSRVGARKLIPPWLNPWRHRYLTTVARHAALIAEDGVCAICHQPLVESAPPAQHEGEPVTAAQRDFEHTPEDVWVTPCRHVFHAACLATWMDQRMECPLCRFALPEP